MHWNKAQHPKVYRRIGVIQVRHYMGCYDDCLFFQVV